MIVLLLFTVLVLMLDNRQSKHAHLIPLLLYILLAKISHVEA